MKEYRICSRCILDTTVPDIVFDKSGICNYCTEFIDKLEKNEICDKEKKQKQLREILERIKNAGKGRRYDCLLGVSGGADSSYALYMAKKLGLNPLAVHIDNGWNTELSASNINNLVKALNVDLRTYVVDWEEFRNLQRSFFKANVVDIEMLTDNLIVAVLYRYAYDNKIKFILTGQNLSTEGMRGPTGWSHCKTDLMNIKAIHRKFGEARAINNIPLIGTLRQIMYENLVGISRIALLDYVPYIKAEAMSALEKGTNWRSYEKKHYESVFTRFYQGYILPRKFGVDKRRYHYSNLICSGQLSRNSALELMGKKTYDDESLLKEDRGYVIKKLGFTEEEFEQYLSSSPVPHERYRSIVPLNEKYSELLRFRSKILSLLGLRKK